jgi:hypothetical protein
VRELSLAAVIIATVKLTIRMQFWRFACKLQNRRVEADGGEAGRSSSSRTAMWEIEKARGMVVVVIVVVLLFLIEAR